MSRSRYFYISLLFIVLLSIFLRLEVSRELFQSDILSYAPPAGTDMHTYLTLASDIFDGKFHRVFYFQPFYYAAFLPFLYLFFGKSIIGILIVQACLGGLTVWLTGLSASMLAGRRAGIFAAVSFALCQLTILYTAYVLIVTLKAFLIVLLFYLILLAIKRKKIVYWSLTGGVCAILVTLRANTVFFLPCLFLLALWSSKGNKNGENRSTLTAGFKPVIFIAVFFILGLLPFSLHNSLITGEVCGPTVGVGWVHFILGNNPEAHPGGILYTTTTSEWIRMSKSQPLYKIFLGWVFREPFVYAELLFRKLLLFWDSADITNNIRSINTSIGKSSLLKLPLYFTTSFFLIMFITSIPFYIRKTLHRKDIAALYILVTSYCISIVLFMNVARYKVALIPLLAVTAGITAEAVFFSGRRGKMLYRRVALTAVSLAIAIFIVYFLFPLYRDVIGKRLLTLIQPSGIIIPLDNKIIYTDTKSNFLSSHYKMPLSADNIFCKQFSIDKRYANQKATLQIPMEITGKALVPVVINDKTFYLNMKRDAVNERTVSVTTVASFSVQIPENGKFYISKGDSENPSEINIYIDRLHDFHRSLLNNSEIDGEIVCRLIIPGKSR